MKTSFKYYCTFIMLFCFINYGFSQKETAKWKALIALGLNSPSQGGFVEGFEGNTVNFPTINLGVQRMFTPKYGVKLDLGYNRFGVENELFENKINYTRINAQLVYDTSQVFYFLPQNVTLVGHIGPGYSMVKPLGDFKDNDVSYLNAMAGIEIHHYVSRTVNVFADVSYIYGFSSDFENVESGLGSFNGNVATLTFGVAISLSGCVTCN